MKPIKITLRMCVVCRQMKDKSQLIRVVKNKQNEMFVDKEGRAQGRGAFVCLNNECISKCRKQRALNRSFKCSVSSDLYDELEGLLEGERHCEEG